MRVKSVHGLIVVGATVALAGCQSGPGGYKWSWKKNKDANSAVASAPAGPPLPSAGASPMSSPAERIGRPWPTRAACRLVPQARRAATMPSLSNDTSEQRRRATPARPAAILALAVPAAPRLPATKALPGGYGNQAAAAGGAAMPRAVRQPRRRKPALTVRPIRRHSTLPPIRALVRIRAPRIRSHSLSGHRRCRHDASAASDPYAQTAGGHAASATPAGTSGYGAPPPGVRTASTAQDTSYPSADPTARRAATAQRPEALPAPAIPTEFDHGAPTGRPELSSKRLRPLELRCRRLERRLRQHIANVDARNRLPRNPVAGSRAASRRACQREQLRRWHRILLGRAELAARQYRLQSAGRPVSDGEPTGNDAGDHRTPRSELAAGHDERLSSLARRTEQPRQRLFRLWRDDCLLHHAGAVRCSNERRLSDFNHRSELRQQFADGRLPGAAGGSGAIPGGTVLEASGSYGGAGSYGVPAYYGAPSGAMSPAGSQ